jgi:hypothetical protein
MPILAGRRRVVGGRRCHGDSLGVGGPDMVQREMRSSPTAVGVGDGLGGGDGNGGGLDERSPDLVFGPRRKIERWGSLQHGQLGRRRMSGGRHQ